MPIDEDRDRLVRERAYVIWESEGCPHGRNEEHWRMAEVELGLLAEEPPPSPRKGRTRPVKARGMATEGEQMLSRKAEAAPSRTRKHPVGGTKATVVSAGKRGTGPGARRPPKRRK